MNVNYHRNRGLLACAAIVSLLMFWYAGKWFHIPLYPGFDVSLLHQPAQVLPMIVIFATIILSTIVCTLIAGSVRTEAGLFCTALGLMALRLRGGAIHYTLFDERPGVFYLLAIETVLLYAMFGVGWLVVRQMRAMGLAGRSAGETDVDYLPDEQPRDQKILATALQACATATLALIFCRNDNRVQMLASVGTAALLGSMIAMLVAPTRPSIWFWPGPMLVAILGYLWSSLSPENLPVGRAGGYFSALARPTPLDYASAGIAGAMLGYWFACAWHRQSEHTEHGSDDHTNAPSTITPL